MSREITCRNDLSFTALDDAGRLLDWHPRRQPGGATHASGEERGQAFFAEVAQLAAIDEYEAYLAITAALCSREWNSECDEEVGFAKALASVAAIGLRAARNTDDLPFAARFDAETAKHLSVQTRLELMEMQLARLQQKPWRSYDQTH